VTFAACSSDWLSPALNCCSRQLPARRRRVLRSSSCNSLQLTNILHNSLRNKLQSISPTIGVYQQVRSLSRRDAVIIQRLRIGHTRLTHSYLLSGTDQPECSACHCPLTVKHILIECPALMRSRNKHFTASSMKDLFHNVAAGNIINFIKESHF